MDSGPPLESTPPTEDDRARALAAVSEYAAALTARRIAIANNYIENLRLYTRATAGDGGLAMSKSTFQGLAAKGAVKTGFTAPAKVALDKQVDAALQRAIGVGLSWVGKAFTGFAAGLLYDVLVNLIFDPTGKALRAAFRGGVEAGADAVAEAARASLATLGEGLAVDRAAIDGLNRSVLGANSTGALDALATCLRTQSLSLHLPVIDFSLYQSMLETWTLQRAGDEEDGNKRTDPEAYAAAHAKLAPDGNLARKDLFIHQCRYEFERLGVDAEPRLLEWSRRLEGMPPETEPELIIARLGPMVVETDKFKNPDRFLAAHHDTLPFPENLVTAPTVATDEALAKDLGPAPVGLARSLAERGRRDRNDNAKRFRECLKSGGVGFRSVVSLTDADGAIFVDRFEHRIWGTRHKADGSPRMAGDPPVPTHTWSESPD